MDSDDLRIQSDPLKPGNPDQEPSISQEVPSKSIWLGFEDGGLEREFDLWNARVGLKVRRRMGAVFLTFGLMCFTCDFLMVSELSREPVHSNTCTTALRALPQFWRIAGDCGRDNCVVGLDLALLSCAV